MFVFALPHGQNVVERGFSINKEVEIENLKKVSLTVNDWYMTMSCQVESHLQNLKFQIIY